MAETSGRPSARMVSARWALPPTGSSQGRNLCPGIAAAAAAKASGTRTRASAMSLLERAEAGRVDGGEFAADVLDDDAHHEDADDEIEQDADLHEEGHRFDERKAHDEDAVLEREIAHHLGDGLSARGEKKEAGECRRQRSGDEERSGVLGCARPPISLTR